MKVKEQQFFAPSIGATKYEFVVGKKNPLTIVREDEWFYQLEQDNSKKPLGSLIPTLQYLHRNNAKFLGKNNKPKRMFYNRTAIKQMMAEGYSIVDVDAGIVYSYTEDFSKVVSSAGLVLDNDLPPGTTWCIDFTEPKLPKTRKDVLDEKRRLKEEEAREDRKLRTAAAREAFKEVFEKQKIESDKIKEELSNKLSSTTQERKHEESHKNENSDDIDWGYLVVGGTCLAAGWCVKWLVDKLTGKNVA